MQHESYYISGKITGTKDLNKPKFDAAENWLRFKYGTGCYVINPHNVNHGDHDKSWEQYMRADIRAMMRCECVVVLDDWGKSRGATMEVMIATMLKMPVYSLDNDMTPLKVPVWVLLVKTLLNLY